MLPRIREEERKETVEDEDTTTAFKAVNEKTLTFSEVADLFCVPRKILYDKVIDQVSHGKPSNEYCPYGFVRLAEKICETHGTSVRVGRPAGYNFWFFDFSSLRRPTFSRLAATPN